MCLLYSYVYVILLSLIVAAQMWCLARLLPLMTGHKVPKGDKNWLNFLLLLNIMDYLLAPVVSHNVSSYLRVLIEDHPLNLLDCILQVALHQNFIFMVHYPD